MAWCTAAVRTSTTSWDSSRPRLMLTRPEWSVKTTTVHIRVRLWFKHRDRRYYSYVYCIHVRSYERHWGHNSDTCTCMLFLIWCVICCINWQRLLGCLLLHVFGKIVTQVNGKQLKGKVIKGVCGQRFHTVVYTDQSVFTFGLNAGQLGKNASSACQII